MARGRVFDHGQLRRQIQIDAEQALDRRFGLGEQPRFVLRIGPRARDDPGAEFRRARFGKLDLAPQVVRAEHVFLDQKFAQRALEQRRLLADAMRFVDRRVRVVRVAVVVMRMIVVMMVGGHQRSRSSQC